MTTATQEPLAQRKATRPTYKNKPTSNNTELLQRLTYGVPAPRRMLTPSLLLKKHFYILTYLMSIGLTTAERPAAFYLLRLFAYYGKVYPKAPNYTENFYNSKRSFWRAVAKLEDSGLIDRQNRYLHHLQISNCYRLDKLVLCLIQYLAEHGCPNLAGFANYCLAKVGSHFWRAIYSIRVRLRDPIPLTFLA
ncbi:hypothetical protein ES705_43981 [subsurface metagenome]